MSSVVRQTLYPASGREAAFDLLSGVARAETTQTAAQAHDGSDATYDKRGASGDGDSAPGSFNYGVKWTLDPCTVSGDIDKVRVYAKAKVDGTGVDDCAIYASRPGEAQSASGHGLNSSFGWFYWDFPAKYGGGAYTAADINVGKWGWLGNSPGVDETTYCDIFGSDFYLEVWGPPETQTSTPASVAAIAAVCAASLLLGAVGSSCSSLEIPTSVGVATEAESGIHSHPDSVTIVSGGGGESFLQSLPRDPNALTYHAATVDGGSQPVVLRAHDAVLGDADLATFVSATRIGPYTGNLSVSCTSVAQTSIAGSGTISGVILHAFARVRADAPLPTVTLPKFVLLGQTVDMSSPPLGLSDVAVFGECHSALITTTDGSTPWTWENLYDALIMLTARVHVAYSGIGLPVEFDVAELWVEVVGPIGSAPDDLVLVHRMGDLRYVHPMPATLYGGDR